MENTNESIIETESVPEVRNIILESVPVEAGEMPTFQMRAYTGGMMNVSAFDAPIVVDLAGLQIPSQNIPIRLDHSATKGVGHTQAIYISDGCLYATGLISRDTSWARDVANSGKNGFPWQASIGGQALEAEFVPAGQSKEINGRIFDGPFYNVTAMLLKEISVCDLGADSNTQTIVAKDVTLSNEEQTMENNENEIVEDVVVEASAPKVESPVTMDYKSEIQNYRDVMASESKRVGDIRALASGSCPELEAQAIAEGWSVEKFELNMLRNQRPVAPVVTASESEKLDTQVLECVALESGGISTSRLEKIYGERVLEAHDKYRGMGLQEFCELACGQRLPRFQRDAHGWLQAAFSTTSLPGILSNIANKSLMEGYNYVEDSWRAISKVSSVNDFKTHTRYRMNGSFEFEKVGPGGELKHGKIGEANFTQKAETFGIMFSLTRQMIIDDDLGALNDIPRQIGLGAGEAITDAVWSLLLSNPGNFFSTTNKNYSSGSDTALSIDGLSAGELLFMSQTKPDGRPLGAIPTTLLVPLGLKTKAEILMKATTVNETTSTGKASPNMNPHSGKFNVVASSYLGNGMFTGSSSTAWYLFADPNRLAAIEVAFLGGQQNPTVERADADFDTLGIQFRGYIDFGVAMQDFRGAIKMAGA